MPVLMALRFVLATPREWTQPANKATKIRRGGVSGREWWRERSKATTTRDHPIPGCMFAFLSEPGTVVSGHSADAVMENDVGSSGHVSVDDVGLTP
jgi:hypothetical protein